MFTNCLFNATKNKLDCYGDKNCMKNFCLDLKDDAIKIMNNEEKKEMIPLNKEEKKYNVGKKIPYMQRKI